MGGSNRFLNTLLERDYRQKMDNKGERQGGYDASVPTPPPPGLPSRLEHENRLSPAPVPQAGNEEDQGHRNKPSRC